MKKIPKKPPQQQQVADNNNDNDNNNNNDSPEPEFSPVTSPAPQKQSDAANTNNSSNNDSDTSSHDDIMEILEAHDHANKNDIINIDDDDDDDDDDDSMFGGDDSERPTLNIDINVADQVTAAPSSNAASRRARKKRRRSSASANSNNGSGGNSNSSTTKKALSTTNLLDLWNQLQENQAKYELAVHTLSRLQDSWQQTPAEDLANLVGDALQHAVRQHHRDVAQFGQQRRLLHQLAQERDTLQRDAARYLPWLEQQVQIQDVHDLEFCDVLEIKLRQLQPVHAVLVAARAQFRAQQQEQQRRQQEREQQERDQQDLERFRKAALAKETEAKPGMVWNPTTREYQSLNTDESWRD